MDNTLNIVPDIKESLNEYFKLKQKYELQITANKKKIINSILSNREKRSEYMKLKPKCINCKRPGGTIFKINFISEDEKTESYREYNANCGIISNPCNLKIKIRCGKTELITDILKNVQDEIKDIKNIIIDDKNKLLFGYLTTEEALENFDYSKDMVSSYSELYEDYLGKYNDIVDNTEKKLELEESITNSYIQINQIKDCIKKNKVTDNNSYITDAINIYDTSLIPTLNKIRNLKYNENFIWHNESTNSCNLIQNVYSISNLSFSSFQSNVVSFDIGLKATKRLKATKPFMIIESDDSDKLEEQNISRKQEPIPIGELPRDEPIYGKGKDGIAWNIEEYNKLWDLLPIKFKTAIRLDNKWMTDFMYTCVNSRAKGNACEVIAPEHLKIPPVKLENNKYDLGVEIYTNLFNKLPVSLQETYLKLFSTDKDGNKNYDMLLEAMNKLVEKETNFERGYF